jgi:hypothetical protein
MAAALRDAGYLVWVDIEGLATGGFAEAISSASAVVACFSEAFARSPACRVDLSIASGHHKRVYYVNVGSPGYTPESYLSVPEPDRDHSLGWLSFQMRGAAPWADCRTPEAAAGDGGVRQLLRALSHAGPSATAADGAPPHAVDSARRREQGASAMPSSTGTSLSSTQQQPASEAPRGSSSPTPHAVAAAAGGGGREASESPSVAAPPDTSPGSSGAMVAPSHADAAVINIAELQALVLQASDEQEQYSILGEALYARIERMQPERAGKITGMLLELGTDEVLNLLRVPSELEERVGQALDVLVHV